MAPAAGLEPATYWLTANRSTTELCRNTTVIVHQIIHAVKTNIRHHIQIYLAPFSKLLYHQSGPHLNSEVH